MFKQCNDCGQTLPVDQFYWVSKSSGMRRGQCKPCMMKRKREQRDPSWTPSCSRCGERLPSRTGPGRRLCETCFDESYEGSERRPNGAHLRQMKPCTLCGGKKERLQRGKLCNACRPWARYGKSLRRFGLTPAEYVAILEAQGGGCYICGTRPGSQRLAIDHDHSMPEGRAAVRGLLCNDCNFARLPIFNEQVDMLLRAAAYLQHPPAVAALAQSHGGPVAVSPTVLGLPAAAE